jgi:hypothetical protein
METSSLRTLKIRPESSTKIVCSRIGLLDTQTASKGKGFSPYRTGPYTFSHLFALNEYWSTMVILPRLNCTL